MVPPFLRLVACSCVIITLMACGQPGGSADGGAGGSATAGGSAMTSTVAITLTRASGVIGMQRINFGLPLADGVATTTPVAVRVDGSIVPTFSRSLAAYPSGNSRSFQIQFDAADTVITAEVLVGTAAQRSRPSRSTRSFGTRCSAPHPFARHGSGSRCPPACSS